MYYIREKGVKPALLIDENAEAAGLLSRKLRQGNSGRDLELDDRELITPQAYGGV